MANKYTVMSEEAIRYMCGLIRDVVSLPSEIISNINLADNLTFSNIHIKDLVEQCLIDAKDYADLICGSLIKLTCKKTTTQPTLDNSELNIIYLYSSDGNDPYEQYLKISDTELIDMGSTSISLNDYLTVTDAVSTYAKKVDLDALTTEVTNIKSDFTTHKNNADVHITSAERTKWDKTSTDLTTHTSDTDIHITSNERTKWNSYNTTINEMKTNFQDGVNTIYDSVVAKGVTPIDKSPSEISNAIANIGEVTELIYTANSLISSYKITDTKFKKYIISGTYFGGTYSSEREITVSNGIGKKLAFFFYNNSTTTGICQGVYIVEKNSKEDQTKITFNNVFNLLSIVGII